MYAMLMVHGVAMHVRTCFKFVVSGVLQKIIVLRRSCLNEHSLHTYFLMFML